MISTKRTFLQGVLLEKLSEIKESISLLEKMLDTSTEEPEQLLEDICRVREVPVALIKSKNRSLLSFKIRITFFGICKEQFPGIKVKEIAKVLDRKRCSIYKFYPNTLSNDPVVRKYYLETKKLLDLQKKED